MGRFKRKVYNPNSKRVTLTSFFIEMSLQLHLTGRSPRDKYVTCGTLASATAKLSAGQGEQSDGVSHFYHSNEGALVKATRGVIDLFDTKCFAPHIPHPSVRCLKGELLLYTKLAEPRALVIREEQQGYHKSIFRVGMSDYRTALGSIVFSAKGTLVSLGVLTSHITSTINHITE